MKGYTLVRSENEVTPQNIDALSEKLSQTSVSMAKHMSNGTSHHFDRSENSVGSASTRESPSLHESPWETYCNYKRKEWCCMCPAPRTSRSSYAIRVIWIDEDGNGREDQTISFCMKHHERLKPNLERVLRERTTYMHERSQEYGQHVFIFRDEETKARFIKDNSHVDRVVSDGL
jgi:hypothetical protein